MRHAYLLIAHNDFELLSNLVKTIDDRRNDIYIHIDKKVKTLPIIDTQNSNVYILKNRIDARWGDYSLVEVELALIEAAYKRGEYDYYHIISGVDLPIKTQDYIHDYCETHRGLEFIGFADASEEEINWRSQHVFLFPRMFKSNNVLIRGLRFAFTKLQDLIKYKRTVDEIRKGCQWCSVTGKFVEYILLNKNKIKHLFHHTFCPDEMFMQTMCWNSTFRNKVFDISREFSSCKRFIKWENGELKSLSVDDVQDMIKSEAWFARKFSSENKILVVKIVNGFRL